MRVKMILLITALLLTLPTLAEEPIWRSLFTAGQAALKVSNEKKAEQLFQSSLKEARLSPASLAELSQSLFALSLLYASQKNYTEARPLAAEAIKTTDQAFGETSVPSKEIHELLGDLDAAEKKYDDAESQYRKAVTDVAVGQTVNSSRILGKLAGIFTKQGKLTEAEALKQESNPTNSLRTTDQSISDYVKSVRLFSTESPSLRSRDLHTNTGDNYHRNFEEESAQIRVLNNEGVKALNANDYELAISRFEQALNVDPNYRLARLNLAIASNNFGLQLKREPKKALREFHKSLYLDPSNATTRENVNATVSALGKNPESFDDRELLGKEANISGDFMGALVEFGAACKIRPDHTLLEEMQNLISTHHLRGEPSDYVNRTVSKPRQDVDYGPYFADLQRRIKRAWFPPKENHPVVVYFRIHENGDLSALRLRSSSGSDIANEAALQAVKNAAPFRRLPDGADAHVDLQFTFDDSLITGGGTGNLRRF